MFEARIERQAFDVGAEHARLSALGPEVGAVVLFTGQVRDEPLLLDHYPAMAARQLRAILEDAKARWPLLGAVIVHRFGPLDVGAPIVLVGTASSHRAAAFEAATFLMDYLKTGAPFWKRGGGGWVDARDSDLAAQKRWERT
jgi:molybdopterin synthase catalytic subunit